MVGKWLEISDYDYDTAKAMFDAGRFVYVAFMCQQAVEKALKAVITGKTGEYPPKIHKLEYLAAIADIKNDLTNDQQILINELSFYYLNNRYPDFKKEISKRINQRNASELLIKTGEFLKWIKEKLN